MSDTAPSTSIVLTVEIEFPEALSDEYQDALVEDLTYEPHLDRLRLLIKKWARFISSENCHVSLEVE